MFLVLTFQSILRPKFDIFYNGISVPLILNQSMLLTHNDCIIKREVSDTKMFSGSRISQMWQTIKKESPEDNFCSCRQLIKHKNCIILQEQNVTFLNNGLDCS